MASGIYWAAAIEGTEILWMRPPAAGQLPPVAAVRFRAAKYQCYRCRDRSGSLHINLCFKRFGVTPCTAIKPLLPA